ncbi:MAG TPA: hypothetical protein VF473_03965 [Cyclobacteriaceae bacterium]
MRILLLWLLSFSCFAQKQVATFQLPSEVSFAAVDRPGDLYVIMKNGEAVKLDKNAKQIGKRKFATIPTVFDPKDGTRAFAYYRGLQATESIAPDLSFGDFTPLHPEFAVNTWLVCPSKNEFWILDSADFSLKKTKEKGTAIAYESRFATQGNPAYMREYLNFLFVLDKGIHVLNNLGKEIRKIDADVRDFSFLGEELYYVSKSSLQLIDLYTTEKREIPLPHPVQFAFLTDDRMILIAGKTVEFLEFTP